MTCSPPCLSLDLEVGKRDRRIHAFAAVRPHTGQRLVYRSGDLPAALARLDDLCEGAAFLVGHNMGLHHDRYVVEERGSSRWSFPYSFGYVNQRAFAAGAPASSSPW